MDVIKFPVEKTRLFEQQTLPKFDIIQTEEDRVAGFSWEDEKGFLGVSNQGKVIIQGEIEMGTEEAKEFFVLWLTHNAPENLKNQD